MKFEPSEREKQIIFESLPCHKDTLISIIKASTGLTEKYARSLIWNMKRLALIYTKDRGLLDKV